MTLQAPTRDCCESVGFCIYQNSRGCSTPIKLIIADVAITPIRIALRVLFFFSGDFVRSGLRLAEIRINREKKLSFLEKKTFGCFRSIYLQGFYVLEEAIKNIVKIVTYPFATISLLSLDIGLLLANSHEKRELAREFHGRVEHFYARTWIRFEVFKPPGNAFEKKCQKYNLLLFHLSESTAVCMLPSKLWKRANLFALSDTYNRQTLRALYYRITIALDDDKLYWQKELKALFPKMKNLLDIVKKNMKGLSPSDMDEVNRYGTLKPCTAEVRDTRKVLIALEENLIEIEKTRLHGGSPDYLPIKKTLQWMDELFQQILFSSHPSEETLRHTG